MCAGDVLVPPGAHPYRAAFLAAARGAQITWWATYSSRASRLTSASRRPWAAAMASRAVRVPVVTRTLTSIRKGLDPLLCPPGVDRRDVDGPPTAP